MNFKILTVLIAFFVITAFKNHSIDTAPNEVKIGNQIWMSENLNVVCFQNGDTIPEAQTPEEWDKAWKEGKAAWCHYKNDIKTGKKFGKLYNWFAVNDARKLAPSGWHIPSADEWAELEKFIGKNIKNYKSIAKWGLGKNGSNLTGFNAYPCPSRYNDGIFDKRFPSHALWWSTTNNLKNTKFSSDSVHITIFTFTEPIKNRKLELFKNGSGFLGGHLGSGFNVRCIKN